MPREVKHPPVFNRKMTEEERQKRLGILRKTHDEIKEHPYWEKFDRSLLKDVCGKFLLLARNIWKTSDETDPYYVILMKTSHDFCCMCNNLIICEEDEEEYLKGSGDENKLIQVFLTNVHMVMQVFLTNVHNMILGSKGLDIPTGYTCSIVGGVKKFQAFLEEDGKYHAYNMVTKDKIPVIRRYLEKYASLKNGGSMTEWAKECMAELDGGKTEIGKVWKITE